MEELRKADPKWIAQVQDKVYSILGHFIAAEHVVDFVKEDKMHIWIKVFTHETFDLSFNNEDLEFQGDIMLQSVFPKYLMKRFSTLHKKEYTFLNTYYMSGNQQLKYSNILGLSSDIIRIGGTLANKRNIVVDIFEAFVGALDTVAEMVQEGSSYLVCYNMIAALFENINIDLAMGLGDPKTQTTQIFSRFGPLLSNYERNLAVKYNKNAKWEHEFIITLDNSQMEFLKSRKIPITRNVFRGFGTSKKFAETAAYTDLFDYLKTLGVTSEWARLERIKLVFANPLFSNFKGLAEDRMRRDGFIEISFSKPAKTSNSTDSIIILKARKQDYSTVTLGTVTIKDNSVLTQAQAQLLKSYAEGAIVPFTLAQT
jgi:dsRNA-specific ribonuclease